MRALLRHGVVFLWVAVVAAGAASGDTFPWSGKWGRDPQAQQAAWAARDEAQPTLVGRVGSDWRGERYIDVRGHETTYVVDVSRADIRGGRRAQIRRGDRVLIWGRLIGRNALAADRIRILRDGDKVPCAQCGKTDCLHPGRYDYEPRDDPRDDAREDPNHRVDRRLDGRVTRASNRTSHRDIRVAALGTEWRVDVPTGARITRDGESVSVHTLRVGEYVRIRGERTGDQVFRAERIEVSEREEPSSPWPGPRSGEDGTYTGSIRSLNDRERTFALRLNLFETYVVHVAPDTRILRDGREIRFRDLREEDRVRVRGRLDPDARVVEARQIEVTS